MSWTRLPLACAVLVLACTPNDNPLALNEDVRPAFSLADAVVSVTVLGIFGEARGVSDNGKVLTPSGLLDASGFLQLAPFFEPSGLSNTTIAGNVNSLALPTTCPTAALYDIKSRTTRILPWISGFDASSASDVNDSGHAAGWFGIRNTSVTCSIRLQMAALWKGDNVRILPPLDGGAWSVATSVNNRGQVAGFSDHPINERAVLWTNGKPEELGTLGGQNSRALAVNDLGHVVGYSTKIPGENGPARAFLWKAGSMYDLGTLGGHSVARGINNRGLIVGSSSFDTGEEHAFASYNGKMLDLGTLGGTQSRANAVNEAGQIVGVAQAADGTTYTVMWEIHLNDSRTWTTPQ